MPTQAQRDAANARVDEFKNSAVEKALNELLTGTPLARIIIYIRNDGQSFGYDDANRPTDEQGLDYIRSVNFKDWADFDTWAKLYFLETVTQGKRTFYAGVTEIAITAAAFRRDTRRAELAAFSAESLARARLPEGYTFIETREGKMIAAKNTQYSIFDQNGERLVGGFKSLAAVRRATDAVD